MKWGRVWGIMRKEVAHVLRDPFTLALALGLPVFMVAVFGICIEFNVKQIPIAVLDSDHTLSSRQMVDLWGASGYFQVNPVQSPSEGLKSVESEWTRAFLVIPPRFEKEIKTHRRADVQILLDGADNSTVSAIAGYLGEMQRRSSARLLDVSMQESVKLKTRFLFNQELNSRYFVIPGLCVVVMSILSILLTALTVAREWENGSMELLLSTPVKPIEIIIGKLAPYAGLGMAAVTLVYVMARFVFSVPFEGGHIAFLLGSLLFLATYLGQGLLISVAVRKQQIAMQMAMLTGLLPSQLLSGFIFPVESMPPFFQYFTMILPARWFMNIARDCFLQGSSIWEMRTNFIALLLIGTFMISMAVRKFKRDVEP